MFDSEDYVVLSALQHWLYCPRQYALIHLEQTWSENKFTAEGRILHEKAHSGCDESRGKIRITRSMPVSSAKYGLVGQCDIVEFHQDGTVVPVEYKRGKPKLHHADEAQLCAQAMCLEEMLGIEITCGALFYGERLHRTNVEFDSFLRNLVINTADYIRQCILNEKTPLAIYDPKLCDACSMFESCQPRALNLKISTNDWFRYSLNRSLNTLASSE